MALLETWQWDEASFVTAWEAGVHRGGVLVFTDPYELGYRVRTGVDVDDRVAVPYADLRLRVADLLDIRPV